MALRLRLRKTRRPWKCSRRSSHYSRHQMQQGMNAWILEDRSRRTKQPTRNALDIPSPTRKFSCLTPGERSMLSNDTPTEKRHLPLPRRLPLPIPILLCLQKPATTAARCSACNLNHHLAPTP
ncbi:hypothetical protein PMAYCL1PPCAC_30595, partial [Pristionchus mayeri]